MATILLVGVDLFFRGKLDVLLGGSHRLTTTDSIDPPDLVIVDVARVDPDEVAESYPDVPILGFTNHTDTAGPARGAGGGPRPDRRQVGAGRARIAACGRARRVDSGPVTYIIAEPCIDIKDLSCVDVCPVDCIHVADRMLVIDPEECIDCGACEPECPVEAIFPEDALPEKWEPFVKINYAYGDGMDVVNQLAQTYAEENNVQNPPLDER